MAKDEDLEMVILDEIEKENLERLTNELIQVFNFNNIDKSSEKLSQRALKVKTHCSNSLYGFINQDQKPYTL